jgi:hypothetical protein
MAGSGAPRFKWPRRCNRGATPAGIPPIMSLLCYSKNHLFKNLFYLLWATYGLQMKLLAVVVLTVRVPRFFGPRGALHGQDSSAHLLTPKKMVPGNPSPAVNLPPLSSGCLEVMPLVIVLPAALYRGPFRFWYWT